MAKHYCVLSVGVLSEVNSNKRQSWLLLRLSDLSGALWQRWSFDLNLRWGERDQVLGLGDDDLDDREALVDTAVVDSGESSEYSVVESSGVM